MNIEQVKTRNEHKIMGITPIFFITLFSLCLFVFSSSPASACTFKEKDCALLELRNAAEKIENQSWRDQIYRELAKLLASEGRTDEAIAVLPLIKTPDKVAMSIRGIGMAAADLDWNKSQYDDLFSKLRAEAEKIQHPPSYAIALTYIAMAQAFAGDNEGAWKTASDMKNDALRHKAFGETAEIQAEHQDLKSAMKSISFIESQAFRNKAYATISKIMANQGLYEEAFEAAKPISNAYKKAKAIEELLNKRRYSNLKAKMKNNEPKAGGAP